jgi:tetratricopeptide (TPR) repeat protein
VDELRRTVREQEPLSPSAKLQTLNNEELTKTARRRHIEPPRLLSQLRGDLDWIVLKCLEKDRTRRYATANGLAMDIERYLHEEAVLARPPSRVYRLQKLVRRNRVAFLFGATAVTALLLGTIISTRMFLKEREARASEARFRKDAELREEASHIALLVTQRRFEEADKLLAAIPVNKPSIELAAELRALGDWHAAKGRWQQAAERFGSLVRVDELDGSDVSSLDQLRLAAALLQTGDRRGYEQWRQTMPARFTPAAGRVPSALIKACLLLPAESTLLQWLPAASEAERKSNAKGLRIGPGDQPAVAWSDTKVLLQYRRGDFSNPSRERFLADNAPRLATFSLIQAMAFWQLKDYWGAMMIATKGYALVQSGARQGLVAISVQPDIFPGMSEPEYLQAPWYDWAGADLLTREWSQMVFEAEQAAGRTPGSGAKLEQVALLRAAGEWHALRGEWADALRCFRYCLQHNQQDSLDHSTMDYQNAAVACLKLGDEPGYLGVREEMTTRFKDPDQKVAARTLNVGIMRSFDNQSAARLQPFADLLRDALPKQTGGYDAESVLRLALFEFRRGNFTNAIDIARRSAASVSGMALPNAMTHVISAMSLHHLGNHSEVPLELAQAKNLTETGFDLEFDMWHWRDWILLHFLLQEADSLMTQAPLSEPSAAPR